jgi:hypothetical protein
MIKQDEADAFFKKTANDYFNKLREMDDAIRESKSNISRPLIKYSEGSKISAEDRKQVEYCGARTYRPKE